MKADIIFTKYQIFNQNITVVLDNLDIRSIKIDELKSIAGDDVVITMLPDLLVMIIPNTGTVVQFGDRRLRVTTQISSTEVRNIWGITKSIMQLIPSNISAYGFNYDLLLDLNLDYQTTDYRFLFPNDLPALEGIIASKIEKFTPRFSFKRDGGLIDITLEPINSSRTKVHGNMHFKSINLPVEEELGQSFTNQLAYLLDLSSQLFNQKS